MHELVVPAELEKLSAVLNYVKKVLTEYGVPDDGLVKAELSVEELFVNIASYAYKPDTGVVAVRCSQEEGKRRVYMQFRDSGKPYNPLLAKDPDVDMPLEDRDIGGLGIFFVKQSMDGAEYKYENGMNILTIWKDF